MRPGPSDKQEDEPPSAVKTVSKTTATLFKVAGSVFPEGVFRVDLNRGVCFCVRALLGARAVVRLRAAVCVRAVSLRGREEGERGTQLCVGELIQTGLLG